MNAGTVYAAIQSAHLHVRHAQGHNARKFQPMAGISHTLNGVAGIGVPNTGGIISRVQQRGFFMPKACLWRAGEGGSNARRACAVRQPEPDRHPIGVGRRDTTRHRQTTMNTSPTLGDMPEIRPVFIARATLEKRIRRELAKQGRKLLKSKPGTAAHREYGQYAIENGLRRVVAINHDLLLLAHELGVLKPGERLRPKYDRIGVITHRNEEGDTDRIEHYVVGQPGAGNLLFDLLEGPFKELADAEESRDLIGRHRHE